MYRRLLENYPTEIDRYDEMLAPDGELRPHWRALIDQLQHLTPEMLRRRAREVRDAIAADGVTYNADPKGATRPWELDLLPQVIAAEEWQHLSAAVAQRATLLNAILADAYGPQTLLAEGLLPPALIFGQHGYLWPCRSIKPLGGVHLHLYAIDLARSPDGCWWAVADRTQGPSGAGYALQNRQIMARALPDAMADMQVQSLLDYFETLRDSLAQQAPGTDDGEAPLIVLLTPGPYNETYSEHAFLAHTLGFPLVEGADLMVRGDMVYLKTIGGLRRVHAIWRRLDDNYCDPLELRADSALGVPGLVQAARLGNVLIANALGSSVVESSALHGFLPAISQRLLGQPLALPSVASWWCGEKPALAYTIENLEKLVIMPAFSSMRQEPVFGHLLNPAGRAKLIESLHAQPHAYVAQEWVRLSQAPVLSRSGEYRLMSRAISLRVFAVAAADGSYRVMAGGLTRVAPRRKDIVSMQHGGASKDVWVLGGAGDSSAAADYKSDTAHLATGAPRRRFDTVPVAVDVIRSTIDISSHAGENLFWMGRYTERAEKLAHLLRCTLQRVNDVQADSREALYAAGEICAGLGVAMPALTVSQRPSVLALQQNLTAAVVDRSAVISVANNLRCLHQCGYQVREHLSLDNWQALNRLPSLVADLPQGAGAGAGAGAGTLTQAAALTMLNHVISACSGLAGHALDDMTRDEGWHFLMLGRHIERLTHAAGLFVQFLLLTPQRQNIALQWLLESASSIVTYRVRYRRMPEWLPVLHLLIFDPSNPHGIAFQLRMLQTYTSGVAPHLSLESADAPAQLLLRLESFKLNDFDRDSLFVADANVRLLQLMHDVINAVSAISDELARRFFTPLSAPVSQGV
jgi:uncharacterized circularly permuted ATP-grasp superfamily protein/uncharacterized alpha-E superfamily protein